MNSQPPKSQLPGWGLWGWALGVFVAAGALVMPAAEQSVGHLVVDRGPGEWAEYASIADRFTANFPGAPTVTDTVWTSEFGAQLKGRIYSATRGNGSFRITAIDYSPIEMILTERAKACPIGAETCRGGADTGIGYWKNDVRGAIDFAAWTLMRRPGVKVTQFNWGFQDMVAGKLLHLTNPDGTRTFASIYFHDHRLIVMEGTVPEAEPEPGLFQQALGWLDETGRGIRYATVYYADPDLPKPPLHQRSFISDFGRIDATGIR
jgi:hypothetical protein